MDNGAHSIEGRSTQSKSSEYLTVLAIAVFFPVIVAIGGCAPSQEFTAVPGQVDRGTVRKETLRMTAERFRFIPDTIRVNLGTLVKLQVTSTEGNHAFQLGAFGIDERVDEHDTTTVEFYASKRGTYGFRCSHFCGLGHMGMNGLLIIE